MLLKLREDIESEIIPEYFAIIDEKSTQVHSFLLVYAERNLDKRILGWPTVRATF